MLTVQEAADRLKVSESTIYALVKAGRLRSHRVGLGRGVIRISDSAIVDYLATTVSEPASEGSNLSRRPRLKHICLSRRPV